MDAGITVNIETSSPVVIEGSNFSVCVAAMITYNESFQEFMIEVKPNLEFVTAGNIHYYS